MTTVTFFQPPPSPIRARLQRLSAPFGRIASRMRAWQIEIDRKRDANSLAALDDRILKDMGISRSEIISVVYCPDQSERRRFHEDG